MHNSIYTDTLTHIYVHAHSLTKDPVRSDSTLLIKTEISLSPSVICWPKNSTTVTV